MNEKPTSIKVIMGIAVFQVLVSWGFYAFFLTQKPESGLVQGILYTASVYTALLVPILFAAMKRNLVVLRACLVLNIVVSLPLKAAIGILLSAISLGLTFRAPTKAYFTTAEAA